MNDHILQRRKICLFTAHSPMIGGGAAIIRSLIPQLPELEIDWHYVSTGPVPGFENGYMGAGIEGQGMVRQFISTYRMLTGPNCQVIDAIVSGLLEMDCDMYWIVSHNEGLRVAVELVRIQKTRAVHLSFHDDWAGALCGRSARYRILEGKALKLTVLTLKVISSFDVISSGMQSYYQKISGRKGNVCHRYLKIESLAKPVKEFKEGSLAAGHIGSIYDKKDFLSFVEMFVEFGQCHKKKVLVHLWGSHLNEGDMPSHLSEVILFHKNLPESEIIPLLSACSFVYAMYPFTLRLKIFSETSLPTKLTSYVQAGRPIFGHGPSTSTLAKFLSSTGTGVLWRNTATKGGFQVLENLLKLDVANINWRKARDNYFGESNITTIREALSGKSFESDGWENR